MPWFGYSTHTAQSVTRPEPFLAEEDAAVRATRSVAAIGTVLGTAALLFMPFAMIRFHQGDVTGDLRISLFDAPDRSTSAQGLWMLCSSLMGMGLGLMLFVGSLGALTFRRWARPVLILWAIGSICFGIVGCFFYYQWLFSPWRSHLAEVRGVVDSLASLGGWGLGTILAIGMLVLLTRTPVKQAFHRRGQ